MSARALWTEGMGLIQVGLGATVVLRRIAIPAYRRWAAVRKAAAARAFAPVRALPVRANLPGGLRSA